MRKGSKSGALDEIGRYHMYVCVINSLNDVPRVAQWYRTMATHTRCCVSVLIMFVVCLHAHVQFCRFDKTDTTATFSDTAFTDRHSDTTIFQLRAHRVWISWSIGSEKLFRRVAGGSRPATPCVNAKHPIHKARRFAIAGYSDGSCLSPF